MRLALALGLLLIPALASAERLIFIPIGRKIPFREVRSETFVEPSNHKNYLTYLGVGVTQDFDVELLVDRTRNRGALGSFNFSYNFISPITDASPGLSVGIRDGLNRTSEGRELYLAATLAYSVPSASFSDHIDVTLGFEGGAKYAPFVGVMIPFGSRLRLLAEHDGFEPAAGLEYDVSRSLGLRWVARQHQTFLSLLLSARF